MSTEENKKLLRQLALGAAAVGAGYLLLRALRRYSSDGNDNDPYEGVRGLVGWTSRLVAAARALESKQRDRLFNDPFAETLAGRKAMRAVQEGEEGGDASLKAGFMGVYPAWPWQQRKIGILGVRVKHFDSELLDCLARPALTPHQVVFLGAGMDTRAWRLDIPQGVKWFEVDTADVLQVKKTLMTSAGAGFDSNDKSAKYPLKAASYAPVATDLSKPSWSDDLKAAGWDAGVGTVFVAEGLLRYLHPPAVEALLTGIAQMSAPGSVLLATISSAANLKDLKEGKGETSNSLAHVVHWGAPDDEAERTAFFERCGWQPSSYDTFCSLAQRVAGPDAQFSFDPASGEGAGKGYAALRAIVVQA